MKDFLTDLVAVIGVIYYSIFYNIPRYICKVFSRLYYSYRYRTVEDAARDIMKND